MAEGLEDLVLGLSNKWKIQEENKLAQAIWRLPHAETFTFIQSNNVGKEVNACDLEKLGEGFLTSPFQGSPIFISADEIWVGNLPDISEVKFNAEVEVSQNGKDDFVKWVGKSIEKIQNNSFQKVVLSRLDVAELPNSFDLFEAFFKLSKAYPNALVAAFYVPSQNSVWLCATPEILVVQNGAGMFKTVSLAGTQSALDASGNKIGVQQASWTQKEIEEQAFVSRYIIECFKRIRLREYVEIGPKTVVAGNLMHLKSEFIVDTMALGVENLASTMLDLLHPTSAVCGTPKEEAIQWISQAEKHDRAMYSGYLGPIGFQNEIQLFVHLRTVQIKGNQAIFYAGCGITEDSIPEKEWEETNMKCKTLKGILMSS